MDIVDIMQNKIRHYFLRSIDIIKDATIDSIKRILAFCIILIVASLVDAIFFDGTKDGWIISFLVVTVLLICGSLNSTRIRAEEFGDRIAAIQESENWIKAHPNRLKRSRFNAIVQSRNRDVVDRLDHS